MRKESISSLGSGSSGSSGSSRSSDVSYDRPVTIDMHHLDALSGKEYASILNPKIRALVAALNDYARKIKFLGNESVLLQPMQSSNIQEEEYSPDERASAPSTNSSERESVPFVSPDHLLTERRVIFVFCAIAVASEMTDYPIFQTQATYKSYRILAVQKNIALTISLISAAIFDTYVNVRAENIANDALAAALNVFESADLPKLMTWLLRFSQGCSILSFICGACGNLIGLMEGFSYLFPSASERYNSLMFSIFAILSIPTGVAYYAVFNIKKFKESFEMFVDFIYANKKDLTLNKARAWASLFESINVIVFRSLSFAGIMGQTLDLLYEDSLNKELAFWMTIAAFATTAVSVLTTRITQVIGHWSEDRFLLVEPHYLQQARQMDWLTYLRDFFMSRNFGVALISAFGLGLLLEYFLGTATTLGISAVCLLPLLMLSLCFFAQRDLVIMNAAVKAQGDEEYWKPKLEQLKKDRKQRRQDHKTGLNEPLLDSDAAPENENTKTSNEEGRELSEKVFTCINERFKDDWWIKYGVPFCVFIQVFGARGISFFLFEEDVEKYTDIEFDKLGLFLLTGPINMLNWYDMFHSAVRETILARRSEGYLLYAKETEDQHNPVPYTEWRPSNRLAYYWQLFTYGGVDYTTADAVRALIRLDKEQGHVSSNPSTLFINGEQDSPFSRTENHHHHEGNGYVV